jgi:hypothetical protein
MVSASIGKKPQVAPYSGAMLAIVARSARERWSRPSPKNSTNLPTTPFSRSISTTRSTRSVAVTPSLQFAGQAEADHFRDQHGDGLAEHGRLGLDAAHAPAQHAQAVDHGGVRIGAHQRVGIGHHVRLAGAFLVQTPLGQIFQVDLVADARARRHHAEIVEGGLEPQRRKR